jgi:hypothetical protein
VGSRALLAATARLLIIRVQRAANLPSVALVWLRGSSGENDAFAEPPKKKCLLLRCSGTFVSGQNQIKEHDLPMMSSCSHAQYITTASLAKGQKNVRYAGAPELSRGQHAFAFSYQVV